MVDRVVVEEFTKASKRKERAKVLVNEFKKVARNKKLRISSYGIERVAIAFESFGAKTKYQRAVLVTKVFHELVSVLPPKRRI